MLSHLTCQILWFFLVYSFQHNFNLSKDSSVFVATAHFILSKHAAFLLPFLRPFWETWIYKDDLLCLKVVSLRSLLSTWKTLNHVVFSAILTFLVLFSKFFLFFFSVFLSYSLVLIVRTKSKVTSSPGGFYTNFLILYMILFFNKIVSILILYWSTNPDEMEERFLLECTWGFFFFARTWKFCVSKSLFLAVSHSPTYIYVLLYITYAVCYI